MVRHLLLFVALSLTLSAQGGAGDWPQFLGPDRNGVYRGPALADAWPANGPRVVWQKPIGQGLSGPVVAQGRVILFHRVGNREVVESLDAKDGASQWSYGYSRRSRENPGSAAASILRREDGRTGGSTHELGLSDRVKTSAEELVFRRCGKVRRL